MAESEQTQVIQPKKKMGFGKKLIIILAVIVAFLGVCSLMIVHQNNQLEKKFYQVKSNKVVDNIRIVALADLHLKGFGKDNEKLVAEVKNLSPDIVAIVGDMNLESQPDNYSSVISLCKQLNEIAPVYYCLGNHEIDAMLFKNSNIYKDIKAEGIKIFNNETETVNIGGTAIDIIGLTQNPTEFDEYGKDFFEKAMSADDNFKLLLTHYPEYFLGKLNDYDIDLAITGHAHGGQVRLPFIGGLYAADQGLFPKLCDGYHEDGNSKFIVSRGLGKSGIVPRINNKPEIVIAYMYQWFSGSGNRAAVMSDTFMSIFDEKDMQGDLRKDYTVKNYQNGNELRKYMAGDISNSLNKTCEVAYPIYRYTDMMLLQAEARAHQGKWGEALDLVKTVRDRAGLNTLTENDFASEDEVVNYILRERQVELAGEGRRWFDLLRTGKWKEVMKPINGMEQDGNELFPIHYSHILENPKIVQNTYYGNTNN